MTTIAVTRKGDTIAIGADTLSKHGYTCIPAALQVNSSKLMRFGEHIFALAGNVSVPLALQVYMESLDELPALDSKIEVYRFLLELQTAMQDHFFFDPPSNEEEGFKDSSLRGFLANPSGVYMMMGLREVSELSAYYALGGGYQYALGAMNAAFSMELSAADIVRLGIEASAVHDEDSAAPIDVLEIQLDPKRARELGAEPSRMLEFA